MTGQRLGGSKDYQRKWDKESDIIIPSQHHRQWRENSAHTSWWDYYYYYYYYYCYYWYYYLLCRQLRGKSRENRAGLRSDQEEQLSGDDPDPGSSIVEGNRCYGQPRPSLEQPGEMEKGEKKWKKKTGGEIAKYSREIVRKNMNRSTRRRLKREILKMQSPTLDC